MTTIVYSVRIFFKKNPVLRTARKLMKKQAMTVCPELTVPKESYGYEKRSTEKHFTLTGSHRYEKSFAS